MGDLMAGHYCPVCGQYHGGYDPAYIWTPTTIFPLDTATTSVSPAGWTTGGS